jgi:ribonuclease HII
VATSEPICRGPTDSAECLYLGVDEAGYGPNLGPFVVALTAWRGPRDVGDKNWWQLLASAVTRKPDGLRLVVDDSKRVLARSNGRFHLESSVETILDHIGCRSVELPVLFRKLTDRGTKDLSREHWFERQRSPQTRRRERAAPLFDAPGPVLLREALRSAGLELVAARARVLFPAAFNRRLESLASKAEVEYELVVDLIREQLAAWPRTDVVVNVDRLGARKFYRLLVEALTTEELVQAVEETRSRSVYRYWDAAREVEIAFSVRAESVVLPVALASMVAKYLRERCMDGLNAFWAARLSGVAPTAGYPQDAKRFLRDIRPLLERLEIPIADFWRNR